MNFFSSIPPGELSINNLAKNLQIDFKTTENYLHILEEIGLIRFIRSPAGGSRGLQKPLKIILNNTTLLTIVNLALAEVLSIGSLREIFFVQSMQNANIELFYSNIGDYTTTKYHFEIGGKNKTKKQIVAHDNCFLMKDDILHPSKNTLPLYLCGFLY